MKKKIIAALVAISFATVVSAQVLYWQVNPSVTITGGSDGLSWAYATLYAVAGDSSPPTQLMSYKFSDGTSSEGNVYVDKSYFEVSSGSILPAYANLVGSDYTGYSFYIELVNYDNNVATGVARSESVSYSNLGNALQDAANFNSDWSSINAMGSSLTFTAIPEPTSGLLLLVGAAVLGLRRKRQQM